MTKAKELKDRSLDELEANYQDSCKELFNLRNQEKQEKKLEKPHRLRQARREIARLLTIIRQKKQG